MNKTKLLKNALIGELKLKYSREEKHEIVTELLKRENISQRALAKQLNIPYATLHDWVSLRQDNTKENCHVSFTRIINLLTHIDPQNFKDWGRIKQLNELTGELLEKKP